MRSIKSNKPEETAEVRITDSIWKPISTIFHLGSGVTWFFFCISYAYPVTTRFFSLFSGCNQHCSMLLSQFCLCSMTLWHCSTSLFQKFSRFDKWMGSYDAWLCHNTNIAQNKMKFFFFLLFCNCQAILKSRKRSQFCSYLLKLSGVRKRPMVWTAGTLLK